MNQGKHRLVVISCGSHDFVTKTQQNDGYNLGKSLTNKWVFIAESQSKLKGVARTEEYIK